jgi:hypothetical protein
VRFRSGTTGGQGFLFMSALWNTVQRGSVVVMFSGGISYTTHCEAQVILWKVNLMGKGKRNVSVDERRRSIHAEHGS